MHRNRFAAAALCLCTTLSAALPISAHAYAADYAADGISWDQQQDALSSAFQSVIAGNLRIYSSRYGSAAEGSFAVGASLDTGALYYSILTNGGYTYGKQCFIYAQAVYCTLFDDFAYHGGTDTAYAHSEQVVGCAPALSYALLTEAEVLPGAYLRTTSNADGTYNSNYGHSLIILGYDENGVTILEGNADGAGLIRQITLSYESFNRVYLTNKGRVVSHIVQPTADYYESRYGYISPYLLPEPEPEDWSSTTCTIHHLETAYQLTAPSASGEYSWTSLDEDILSVDQDGVITAHKDGLAYVIVKTPEQYAVHTVCVESVDWEVFGDIDCDGTVDLFDARFALDYAVGVLTGFDLELRDEQILRGDINEDGEVNSMDARMILNYYVYTQLTGGAVDAETGWRAVLSS